MISIKRSITNTRSRVNIPALLAVLRYLADHKGVASPDLKKLTGLSRATLSRLFADAEEVLNVRIVWKMDMSLPSRGEYQIKSWGLLNSRRVLINRGKSYE